MESKFNQISSKSGFMKHNGGLLFRKISEDTFEFKTNINKKHLNRARITHGGYLASIIDAGCGSAAHALATDETCVTISLDIKYIAPSKENDEIFGFIKIQKKTKSMIFISCELNCKNKIIALASGVWKILKRKT